MNYAYARVRKISMLTTMFLVPLPSGRWLWSMEGGRRELRMPGPGSGYWDWTRTTDMMCIVGFDSSTRQILAHKRLHMSTTDVTITASVYLNAGASKYPPGLVYGERDKGYISFVRGL